MESAAPGPFKVPALGESSEASYTVRSDAGSWSLSLSLRPDEFYAPLGRETAGVALRASATGPTSDPDAPRSLRIHASTVFDRCMDPLWVDHRSIDKGWDALNVTEFPAFLLVAGRTFPRDGAGGAPGLDALIGGERFVARHVGGRDVELLRVPMGGNISVPAERWTLTFDERWGWPERAVLEAPGVRGAAIFSRFEASGNGTPLLDCGLGKHFAAKYRRYYNVTDHFLLTQPPFEPPMREAVRTFESDPTLVRLRELRASPGSYLRDWAYRLGTGSFLSFADAWTFEFVRGGTREAVVVACDAIFDFQGGYRWTCTEESSMLASPAARLEELPARISGFDWASALIGSMNIYFPCGFRTTLLPNASVQWLDACMGRYLRSDPIVGRMELVKGIRIDVAGPA